MRRWSRIKERKKSRRMIEAKDSSRWDVALSHCGVVLGVGVESVALMLKILAVLDHLPNKRHVLTSQKTRILNHATVRTSISQNTS
jgi:hypothetical protein